MASRDDIVKKYGLTGPSASTQQNASNNAAQPSTGASRYTSIVEKYGLTGPVNTVRSQTASTSKMPWETNPYLIYDTQQQKLDAQVAAYKSAYEGAVRTNKEASRMTFEPGMEGYATDELSAYFLNTNPNYGKRVSDEELADKYRKWQEAEAQANENRITSDYWKSMTKFNNDADAVVADYDKRIAAMEANPNLKREASVAGSGNRELEALKAERDAFVATNTQYQNAAEDYAAIMAWNKGNKGDVASYKIAKSAYEQAEAELQALYDARKAGGGPEIAAFGAGDSTPDSERFANDEEIQAAIRKRDQAKIIMDYAYANRFEDIKNLEDYDLTADKGEIAWQDFKENEQTQEMQYDEYGNPLGINEFDPYYHTNFADQNENWTEDEKKTFYYLFATNRDNAFAYGNEVNAKYAKAEAEENSWGTREWAQRDFGTGAVTSLLSIPAGLVGGLYDYMNMAAENQGAGGIYTTQYGGWSNWSEDVRGSIGTKLNQYGTLPEGIPVLGGKGLGDAYQLMMSMADSSVAVLAGGGITNLMFFGNAAANATRNALERGASPDKALSLGFASGAAEVLGEWISVDKLLSSDLDDYLRNGILKSIAIQGGVEGSEEFFTTLLNTAADYVINGNKRELQQKIEQYAASGMSLEDAQKKAKSEWLEELCFDAVGGFLSGAGMAGGRIGLSTASAAMTPYSGDFQTLMDLTELTDEGSQSRALAGRYQDEFDAYKAALEAQGIDIGSEVAQEPTSGRQNKDARLETEADKRSQDEVQTPSPDRRQVQLDFSEEGGVAAEDGVFQSRANDGTGYATVKEADGTFTAYVEGTDGQAVEVGNYEDAGQASAAAVTAIQNGENQNWAAGRQIVQEQAEEAVQDEATQGQERVAQEEKPAEKPKAEPRSGISALKAARLETALAKDLGAKDRTVLEEKATARLTDLGVKNAGKAASAVVDRVLGTDRGAIGNAVSGLNFKDSRVRIVLQELTEQLGGKRSSASWLGGAELMTVGQNNAWTRTIENGLKQVRVKGSSERLKVTGAKMVDGKLNLTVNQNGTARSMSQDQLNLTDDQTRALGLLTRVLGDDAANAYDGMTIGNMGDVLRVMEYASAFGTVRDVLGRVGVTDAAALASPLRKGLTDAQVLRALAAGRKLGPVQEGQRAKSKRGTGKITLEGGTLNGRKLGGIKDKAAVENSERYKAIKEIAEALGIDIVLYESEVTNDKGDLSLDPNGAYKDGVIWLDWNAGVYNKSKLAGNEHLIFLAMSHELTHFLEQNAEQEYNELRDFITQYMAENGKDFNGMVARKLAEQPDIGHDEAVREVIADACETMLTRSEFVEKLVKEKPSLFDTIWDWIKSFFGIGRETPVTREAKAVQDAADKISEIWDRALQVAVESRENLDAMQEAEAQDDVATLTNGNGDAVAVVDPQSGTMQLSLRTYEEGGQQALDDFLDNQVRKKALTDREATEIRLQMQKLYRICKEFDNGKYAPFSAWSNASVVTYDGRPVFSVVKANGEYKLNLDFSLVCKKRRTLDAVFNEMIRKGIMGNFDMVQESIAKINDIIRENGFETACGLCFVDSKRYRQAMIADAFVRMYNQQVISLARKDQGQKLNFFNYGGDGTLKTLAGGIESLADDDLNWSTVDKILRTEKKSTVKWKIANYLKNNPGARRLVMRGDFMSTAGFDALKANNPELLSLYNSKKGAGGPKAAQSDVQYLNEIIQQNAFNEKAAYAVGGVRIQSFSDYIGRLVFDYVQMVGDLAAKKLPAHSYTKEYLYALQFGLTGIKINMSLVPEVIKGGVAAGLDADGNYAWKDGQSFGSTVYDNRGARMTAAEGFELAKRIQNADGYSKNCGTIAVGVSDEHILKMLGDPDIRMIIPYHKSSLNHIVASMMNIDKYTDYTLSQNTRDGKTGKKITGADFNFNDALQRLGDAKAAANEYLEWCKEKGYIPKFNQFAWHENYYKLLEDFSCYDKDGVTNTPLGAVQMKFPTASDAFGSMSDLIEQGLDEDAMLQAKQEKAVPEIVSQIESVLPEFEEEVRDRKKGSKKAAQEGGKAQLSPRNIVVRDVVKDVGSDDLAVKIDTRASGLNRYKRSQWPRIIADSIRSTLVGQAFYTEDGDIIRVTDRAAGEVQYGTDTRRLKNEAATTGDYSKVNLKMLTAEHAASIIALSKYKSWSRNTENPRDMFKRDGINYRTVDMIIDGVPYTATVLTALNADPAQVLDYGEKFYDITEIKQSVGRAGALRDASTASTAGRATPYLIKHAGGATDMFTITQKQRLVKDQKGIYTSGGQTEKTPMQIAYENAQKSVRTGDRTDRELLLDASDASLTDAEQKARAAYKAQVDGYRSRQQAVTTLLNSLDKAVQDGDAEAATKLRAKLTAAEKKMAEALAGLTEAERGPELREILRREREIQRRRTNSRIRESYGRRELRQKVDRLWKDLTKRLSSPSEKKNIPVNVMMQAVDVLEAINMDGTRPDSKAGQKLRDKLNELGRRYDALKNDKDYRQAAMYDPQVAEFLDNMIELVGDTPINRMSTEQLAAVYNTLKALDHVARSALKVRLRTMEYTAYDLSKRMTEETRSVGKQKAGAIDMYLNAGLTPARMFNRLGGYHKDSTWSQVYEMLNDGQLRQTQLQVEGSMLFEDLLSAKDYGKFVDPKNTVDVGLKDADGNAIEITHGMLVSLYMHLMNEQNRRHVAYGGLTIPGLNDYYNGKKIKGTENAKSAAGVLQDIAEINDRLRETEDSAEKEALEAERDAAADKAMSYLEELQKAVESKLTEYDRQWIAACRELFDGFSKRALNEATMQVYGIKRANVENYFPIWVDGNFLNTPFESVAKDFSLENAGFMKERVDSAKPIRLADVSDVAASQIRKVAQYAGLMPVIHDFNKIWGKTQTGYRDSVRQAVMQTYGQSGVNYIENLMADLNGARGMENSPLGEMLNRLRGHMAQASLTLSLRTAMGQAASYPTAASVLGWEPLAKALAHGGKGNTIISRADQELILKWSPLLKYRLQGYRDPELGQIAQMNSKFDRVWKKARWATGWIQAADGATVGRLWYACEYYVQDHNKALKKGTDAYYEAVAKKFNEVVELTQPNYTTMQRPDILRNPNALVRQLTMFLTQRLQNFNIMYDAAATYSQMKKDRAAGKYGVTKEDVEEAGKQTARAVTSQVAAAGMIVLFKFAADMLLHSMNNYRDDDDKELKAESVSIELLDMFLDALSGNLLGGGEVYDLIESRVRKRTYYGIEVGSLSSVTETIKAANSFFDAVAKGELKWNDADRLIKKLSVLAGIPYANAEKIVLGLSYHVQDAINGELWKFEAGVERTTMQQARRLWQAYQDKDYGKVNKVRGEVDEEHQKDLDENVRKIIKDQFAAGDINIYEANRQLQKYGNANETMLGNFVKDQYKDGKITRKVAEEQLVKWAGKTAEEAAKAIKNVDAKESTGMNYDEIDDAFQLGDISAAEAKKALVAYGLGADKAEMKVEFWGYQKTNPGTSLTSSTFETYWEKYRPLGLTPKVYEGFKAKWDAVPGTDKNGDGKADSGSKKTDRIKLIDSLPITNAQKDALFNMNWSTGLKDTPWHK